MATSIEAQKKGLDEILSQHGLKKQDLDKICSQPVRLEIALKIIEWQIFGHYLGIPSETLHAIKVDHTTEKQRRIALLSIWHTREGSKATYYKLMSALYHQRRLDLVDLLCYLIKQQQPCVSSHPAVLATPSEGQSQTSGQSG